MESKKIFSKKSGGGGNMKNRLISSFSAFVFCGLAVITLGATLTAAVQPSESLVFGPGSGRAPRTNGNIEAQVVGYVTVGGERHHALFAVFGQGPASGMDIVVVDLDVRATVGTLNIPLSEGAYALIYGDDGTLYVGTHGQTIYGTGIGRVYKYNTADLASDPVLLCELPQDGYAFGMVFGPDQNQARAIKEGNAVASATDRKSVV